MRRLHPASAATAARIRADFRARRESLIAVDEAVAAVVGALARTGRLDSTYILFTSDNGFFQGEHRIYKGKYLAYDPSTHVPLLIRGPGIPAGTVSDELVATPTSRPTMLEAAGVDRGPRRWTGARCSRSPATRRLRTRRPVLHEGLVPGDIDRDGAPRTGTGSPSYHAIRTARYLYVEWIDGARELYDRARDPGETALAPPRPPLPAASAARCTASSSRLRTCAGDDVPAADRPAPPLSATRGRVICWSFRRCRDSFSGPSSCATRSPSPPPPPGADAQRQAPISAYPSPGTISAEPAHADLAARRPGEPARAHPRDGLARAVATGARLRAHSDGQGASFVLGAQAAPGRAGHRADRICRSAGRATAISRSGSRASPSG